MHLSPRSIKLCHFKTFQCQFSFQLYKYGIVQSWTAVCDETQNLNETESETFFRYQIFSIPNPILFLIPIFFRYRYFFRYQNFTKPIPILFSIPNFFETDTDTFFETKIFRNRNRYFFRYQFFLKPIPIPSQQLEKFRNREV